MSVQMNRRTLVKAGVGITALGGLPGGAYVGSALAAESKVRLAFALRSAHQSMLWLGTETGLFRKQGLEVSFPAMETGGPKAVAGLVSGDWDFCSTGTVPVAENFLNGGDVVALLRATLEHQLVFIAARRELTTVGHLDGKRIGTTAESGSGQTGVILRLTLKKVGATATYVGMSGFESIYAALAKGEIDAGILPIHLRISGEREHGWNIFELASWEGGFVPSVFATTRKLIVSNRDLVMRTVRGVVETIHAFKTQPDVYIPLLQRFLNISDRKVAEDLYKFYVPLFPQAPRVALAEGIQALRSHFSQKYPAAQKLQESDFVDSSFIDELEQSGFIKRLYGGDARR